MILSYKAQNKQNKTIIYKEAKLGGKTKRQGNSKSLGSRESIIR